MHHVAFLRPLYPRAKDRLEHRVSGLGNLAPGRKLTVKDALRVPKVALGRGTKWIVGCVADETNRRVVVVALPRVVRRGHLWFD